MDRRAFLRALGGGGAALVAAGCGQAPRLSPSAAHAEEPRPAPRTADTGAARRGRPPNLVIIVADDLGYRDVSFNGGRIPTPAIDRIAREGVRLARFYACPICSPTRAGLLTGRWPLRMGIMRAVIPPWRRWGLPPEEKTLAELLAEAGYRRRAIIGKWHLGHCAKKYHPLSQGFTHFYGHFNGYIDYWTHQREGQTDWHRNWETVHEPGYAPDLLAAEAVRFIRESPPAEPFFLYFPLNAVHAPLQAPKADIARFASIRNPRRRIYAAMVAALDRAVGRVLAVLDEKGLADDTLVLFFSDNGGVRAYADNGPLRAGKGSVYEGGIRVCAAVRWPAGGLAGGGTCDALMGYIDVYPTVKRLVGLAERPDPQPLDGADVLEVMRGRAEAPERDWFSYIHQSGPTERLALTRWPWKLVVQGPGILAPEARAKSRCELFNLRDDPREQTDLADRHPDLVDRMWARLRTFRTWQRPGVPAFSEGREGFKAPKDWVVPD